MKKQFEKRELGFFFFWLVAYVLLQNVGYFLSGAIGVQWSVTALFNLGMAAVLFIWIRGHHLMRYYGLCRIRNLSGAVWWIFPLILLSVQNLWNGVTVKMITLETFSYLVCMACVGFLEEVLVRGFLFQSLKKESVGFAVIVSALSFGLAHILNLFSVGGMELIDNMFQVAEAMCIGLLYAVILLRSGSLWPCILSHSVINMLSAFSCEEHLNVGRRMLFFGIEICLMLICMAVLLKGNHAEHSKE